MSRITSAHRAPFRVNPSCRACAGSASPSSPPSSPAHGTSSSTGATHSSTRPYAPAPTLVPTASSPHPPVDVQRGRGHQQPREAGMGSLHLSRPACCRTAYHPPAGMCRAAQVSDNIFVFYGARARAGDTCLVAVLHAASVIGCWGRAAGVASVTVCWCASGRLVLLYVCSCVRVLWV